MMLTWKDFVIIMSVVTLTLVTVNSSGTPILSGSGFVNLNSSEGSSSLDQPDTPRPRRSSHVNLHPSGFVPSDPSENIFKYLTIYDQDTNLSQTFEYNPFNPFAEGENIRYECYEQLRMFCDFYTSDLKSYQCAKKGILLYKVTLVQLIDGKLYNFLDAVHTFFRTFDISIRCVELPKTFCDKEAEIVAKDCMNKLQKDQVLLSTFHGSIELLYQYCQGTAINKATNCYEDLKVYQALVEDTERNDRPSKEKAKKKSREAIVKHVLFNKSLIGVTSQSHDKDYIEHVANRITTGNERHNPYDFCNSLQFEVVP